MVYNGDVVGDSGILLMSMLSEVMIKMACAGNDFTSSSFSAPKYCDTIEEIALRVWPSTQISIDIKVPTMPTAANASVALSCILPTTAVSVIDKIGSEIPEISAGIANLLMFFMLIACIKFSRDNVKF